MSCASEHLLRDKGQATVEAAFTLPVLMILFLMLLQPGIYLYDRMVMSSAASEGCRLLTTASPGEEGICEDYIRRRLSAIPQLDLFHVHGSECSYGIEMEGSGSTGSVTVTITNRLKPLPLLDMTMALAGMTDGSGALEMEASATSATQPDWVSESADGRDPAGWVSA